MERHSLRRFYGRQIFKGALFASTALVLPAVSARIAFAQIAPSTTPQGGQVVGGAASIAQAPGATTVNQASQNAAINWQSFDVGSAAKVQFNQPNASAIALNRVVGGNLSQINGQINANGQIVLINQSGVVFGKGSQVNAESVVVSTSDIATSDFMAGRMNFSGAPKPGAQIVNNGNITARDAGLVGLVAPQVLNTGLITATLGQVILAGGSAFTLDLYGDRLISLDVTQAVRAVDIGGKTLPALVTNTGLIIADGGKITLTAQDADALVTQLINAGGTIRADTVGAQSGTISVQGVGGNISIAGNLLARGTAAGTKGGSVQALTDGAVTVASGAVIDVSGAAGGGYAAIGTDIARAAAGPTDTAAPVAAAVTIAQGATIKADATSLGNGGTITLLSQNDTQFDGAISAQGGAQGGDGGLAELSSRGNINLTGTVTDIAIDGRPGEILLDPATLIVTASGGASSTTASEVSTTYLDGLTGNIVLSATSELEVLSDVRAAATSLSLISGGAVSIEAYVSLNGSLEIDAGGAIFIGPSYSVAPITNQTIFSDTGGLSATDILLNSGTAGIDIGAQVNTSLGGTVALESGGGPIQETSFSGTTFNGVLPVATTISGILQSTYVTGGTAAIDGNVDLTNANAIATLSNLIIGGGNTLVVNDAAPLVITGDVGAGSATFISSDTNNADSFGFSVIGTLDAPTQLVFDSAKLVTEASTATISTGLLSLFGDGANGTVSLPGTANAIAAIGTLNAIDNLSLEDPESLTIGSALTIAKAFTFGGGGIVETGAGALDVPTLSSDGVIGGNVLLANTANSIGVVGGITLSAGTFAIGDAENLEVAGGITAASLYIDLGTGDGLTLDNPAGQLFAAGTGGVLSIIADSLNVPSIRGAIQAPNGTIAIAPATADEAITVTDQNNSVTGLDLGSAFLIATNFGQDEKALQLGNASFTGGIAVGQNKLDDIDLSGAALDLSTTGAITEAGELTVSTLAFNGASFNEDAASSINASLITDNGGRIAGNVLLDGIGNDIGTIANISITGNHELSVLDTVALTAASLTAATIALDATSLLLAGNLTGTAQVTLESGGTIFQSAGTLSAGTLTGTAGGAITLADANVIGTLGAFSAGGNILLDSSALDIAGSVAADGTLTLDGGGATELAGSGVDATVLTSAGATIGGNVNLTAGDNTIGLLTNFLVGNGFGLDLDDTGLLNLAGTVSAGSASIVADTLALGGALNILNSLTLGSGDGLLQTAGTITAGTLASSGAIAGGDVSLDQANHIGTIGNFTVSAGSLTLGNAGTVAVAGTVNAGADEVLLDVGGLTETGAILAGTLASKNTISGNVALTGANTIATLSAFALTGNFGLNDSEILTLDGILATGSAKTVSFGGDGVTEAAGGEIDAGTLAGIGTISGDILLAQTNTIGAVNGLTLGGTLDLADSTSSLAIGGLQASAASFTNLSGSNFNVTGFLNVAGELVIDIASGILQETGGSITAASLSTGGAQIASAVLGGVNHIGALDTINTTGTFSLTDQTALDIANSISATGINLADNSSLTIDALLQSTSTLGVALAAPSVVIDAAGAVTIPANGLVSVAADTFSNAGSVTAPSGTFAIAPYSFAAIDLGGATANELDLSSTDFAIANLSELIIGTAAGHTAATLTIDGFSASSSIALVSLFATGEISDLASLDANAIAFSGAGFSQSATGEIITTSLSAGGSISGNVLLTSTLNNIATLGPLSLSSGTLALFDAGALVVASAVSAADIYLADNTPGGIVLDGALQAPGGTIALTADALSDSGAVINAGTGTVDIAPFTASDFIDLGGSTFDGLQLSPALISLINAGELAIGTAGGNVIYAESVVSVSAAELLLTGSELDFQGTLAGPGLLSLASAGDVVEGAAAVIKFATIAGVSGDTGLGGHNTIGTIGDFSASGNIVLNDFESLVIDGLVQTTDDISLEGEYFREIAGGTLSAAILNSGGTTIGGDVFLTSANKIGTLADFYVDNAGTLDFTDGQALILGAVSAPTVTLSASNLDFEGNFTATGLLALQTAGSVTQGTGTISAGTLTSLGSIGGNVLLGGLNSILSLGTVSLGTGGTLDLNDATALSVTGPVTAPIATISAAGITFAGNFDAATALTLASAGAVTQSSGIITTTLLSSLGSLNGNVSLADANLIGTLANISVGAGDTLALNDSGNLTLAGNITAPFATFTAATIDLSGNLTDASLLALGGAEITQTAGTITAGDLTGLGTIAGDVILTLANAVGTLGNLDLLGNFELNDTASLDIAGLLTAKLAQFADPDTIFETGAGAIDAATLTSGAATLGGDLLLAGANTIGTLGALALATGTLDLADAGPLEIAGSISAPVATIAASAIDIAGALNGTYLALASLGTVSESTGTIGVGTLVSTGAIGGDAYLTQTNVIGTLANFTMGTGATLSLTDGETLTLAGLVDAPNATFTAPGLIFDGTLNAGQVLALTSATSVTEGIDGDIIAGMLISAGHVDGDVILLGTNAIGTIGNFAVSTASTFALNDGISLDVAGTLAGGFITLAGAEITIPGSVFAASLLDLASSGSILEPGFIDTAFLTSGNTTIGGNLSLAGANTINTIGNLLAAGNALINDVTSLNLAGLLQVAAGTLALQDGAGIFESTGSITAATLTSGTATDGNLTLLAAGNTIGHLGGIALGAGDTFNLADTGLLTIDGTLAAPFATIAVPTLAIAGAVTGTQLALKNDGLVTETGAGTIAVTTLTSAGTSDGDVFLTNLNAIGTVSTFTDTGTFAVIDGGPMVLAGTVIAPFATVSAGGLQLTGLVNTVGTLALGSTAGITETGTAAIDAGTLISFGSITGPVALLNGNSIATLGSFQTGNALSFKDAESYAIAGIVSALTTITLEGHGFSETGAGALRAATLTTGGTTLTGGATLNGANSIATLADFDASANLLLNDATALTLASTIAAATLGLADTKTITQTSGAILAGTLTSDGAADGHVTLNAAANSISVLGSFTAIDLALDDSTDLTIAAPLNLTGTLALGDAGTVDQTAGTISAAVLTTGGLAVGENAFFNQAGNQIAAIGDFTAAGGLSVTDAKNLALTGNINTGGLYLTDAGFNITQSAGTIGTGVLNASAAGITLAAANSINALGVVSATDLVAYGVRSVTGPVDVGTGTITSPQGLLVTGNISASGNLSLNSAGYLNQTAGLITAANASLTSDQSIKLAGTDNATGTFFAQANGGFTAAGTITGQVIDLSGFSNFTQTAGIIAGAGVQLTGVLEASLAGTVSATNLNISSSHLIDDESPLLTAQNASFDAGESGVILNGNNSIAGQLVAQGGSVYQKSGTIQAGNLTFTSSNYFIELESRVLADTATLTALNTGDASGYGIILSGGVSIGGALALNSGTGIDQSGGYITSGNLTGSAALGITLAANVNAGSLALAAGGTILQSAAGVLNTGNANLNGAGVSLYGTDNLTGNLTAQTTNFRQTGRLTASNAYVSAANYLGLNGAASITNALDVTAGNFIADNASALSARTATFQAPFMFLNGANSFTTNLSADAANGPIVQERGAIAAPLVNLVAAGSIELSGAVTATKASLAAGGLIGLTGGLTATTASLTAGGPIDLTGVTRITDDLYLKAVGDIFAPGTVSAGTLTGAVTGGGNEQASFLGTEDIGTIGSFVMQDSTFALNNDAPVTIIGPLVANVVSIAAVGQITLDGSNAGGLFIAGPLGSKTQTTPQPGDSLLSVTPGANGATPEILQTGTFYVNSGPLAADFGPAFDNAPATLFMTISPAGNIEFEPAPPDNGGLVAPSVDLIMSVGNGGTVSGNVDLLTLLLLSGKATNLTGTLDGLSGEAASGKGNVLPFPKPVYEFNACPIGSVNCIILPIETLPPGNPLQNFDIDQHKKKRLDKSVALPGVATRDF